MKKRLSEESREKLNQLGKVAAKMGVDEFSSETSFLAAANRHLIKQVDISADARKIEKEVKKLIDLNVSNSSRNSL